MSAHFVLLHVDHPLASAGFYAKLLQREPVESSPTFVMFGLAEGLMLGLWSRHTAEPAPTGGPGASELAFVAASEAEVDATHRRWQADGVRIVQAPERKEFGYTCTGVDPDGHRLRVFAPGA